MSTRYNIRNLAGQSILTSRFDPTASDTTLLAILEQQEHHGVRTSTQKAETQRLIHTSMGSQHTNPEIGQLVASGLLTLTPVYVYV